MCKIENYFSEIRRSIRRLKTVVNVLEETVNVLEEALEESPRLREFISDPDQWLQLWAEHIDSFRTSIREYQAIFNQSSTAPQQTYLILNSIHMYSIQVTQYVQLVQEYCVNLLSESGENCFSQIEERINRLKESLNNLPGLVDSSLVRSGLLEFKTLVIAIDHLLNNQSIKMQENAIRLGEEGLNSYHQLVALLRTNIATWESKISLYESALNDASFSADYLLEAREEIREFLTDLGGYTRLVQEIYRNLLEF